MQYAKICALCEKQWVISLWMSWIHANRFAVKDSELSTIRIQVLPIINFFFHHSQERGHSAQKSLLSGLKECKLLSTITDLDINWHQFQWRKTKAAATPVYTLNPHLRTETTLQCNRNSAFHNDLKWFTCCKEAAEATSASLLKILVRKMMDE